MKLKSPFWPSTAAKSASAARPRPPFPFTAAKCNGVCTTTQNKFPPPAPGRFPAGSASRQRLFPPSKRFPPSYKNRSASVRRVLIRPPPPSPAGSASPQRPRSPADRSASFLPSVPASRPIPQRSASFGRKEPSRRRETRKEPVAAGEQPPTLTNRSAPPFLSSQPEALHRLPLVEAKRSARADQNEALRSSHLPRPARFTLTGLGPAPLVFPREALRSGQSEKLIEQRAGEASPFPGVPSPKRFIPRILIGETPTPARPPGCQRGVASTAEALRP